MIYGNDIDTLLLWILYRPDLGQFAGYSDVRLQSLCKDIAVYRLNIRPNDF